MGISNGSVGLAIAAACFLPGNASAFGRTILFDRDREHASIVSSHTAPDLLSVISTLGGRGVNATANKSIEAGLPCPSGHPWQAADSTQKSMRQKSAKPKATPVGSDARQRSTSDKLPRGAPNKTASTSKALKSGTDKSIIFVGGKAAGKGTERR